MSSIDNIRNLVPQDVRELYEIHEWRNALPILTASHPAEWGNILTVLRGFRLLSTDVLKKGGNKSPIASKIDKHFYDLEWEHKSFNTKIVVDDKEYESPTHSVDCYKNKIAVEVEWNNKDTFFDRDLNNFRLLFELRTISVGIIMTRCDDLQAIFNQLGKGSSYGRNTTHMSQLLPRIEGGGGGGCPVLVFGIGSKVYVQ